MIWFTPCIFILLFALFYSLEGLSKISHKRLAIHYYKQAAFVLFCAVITLLIDQNLLTPIIQNTIDNIQIKNLLRFLLFPALLFVLAKIHGGKKDEKIDLDSIRKRRNKN
jgi:hypothetical protein